MKKILFICPEFHNYQKLIYEELKLKGYAVDQIILDDKKYSLPLFFKIVFFLFSLIATSLFTKKLKHKFIYHYYRSEIDGMFNEYKGESYDTIFVVKGFLISIHNIDEINAKNKIIYQWDLVSNYPLVSNIYDYFDKIFTYSFEDHLKYGYDFLPNFFVNNNNDCNKPIDNDIFFIGEYSLKRYTHCCEIIRKCKSLGLNYQIQLVETRSIYPLLKTYDEFNIITNCNINRKKYESLFYRSRAILEMPKDEGSSSSQRLLEGVSHGKLILTKNIPLGFEFKSILELSIFFRLDDREQFIKKCSHNKLDVEIASDFELKNWLDKVLL